MHYNIACAFAILGGIIATVAVFVAIPLSQKLAEAMDPMVVAVPETVIEETPNIKRTLATDTLDPTTLAVIQAAIHQHRDKQSRG